MPRFSTIRVHANPYAALDHDGRPSGAVMFDPVDHHPYAQDTEARRYVGAAIDLEKTVVFQKAAKDSAQSDMQETHWAFSAEAVELPRTHYYLERIRAGELFAADAETAEHAGVKFVPLVDAVTAAKTAALALWTAERPSRALPEWAQSAPTKPDLRPALVALSAAESTHDQDEVK